MGTLGNILKADNYKKDEVVQVTDEDIAVIQKRLLKVLDDIVYTCKKHRIHFQMSGGSCLGTVRHSGFIPWDDDIDINIYRKDIKRFLDAFSKEFSDKYWIHIPGETPNYDFLYVRILTKDVRARDIMDPDKKECGLGTDIFIVENTFDNKILRKIHGLVYMGFRYILSCIRFKKNKEELERIMKSAGELNKITKKRVFLGKVFSVIPVRIWSKLAIKWAAICRNNHTKYVTIPAGMKQFFEEMYERKPFAKSISHDFEGRKVLISADYDTYLTKLYKDYMTVPPKEKQERHVMMELDKEALYNSVDRGDMTVSVEGANS